MWNFNGARFRSSSSHRLTTTSGGGGGGTTDDDERAAFLGSGNAMVMTARGANDEEWAADGAARIVTGYGDYGTTNLVRKLLNMFLKKT